MCVAIWETGEWPEEWTFTFSTFIPLPQKGDLKQCENYRTVVLVSHPSKIILERIRLKTETGTREQSRFRQGRRTRDQITNLRILMQKTREHQQQLCMCFVDFKKAFDSISHDKLWVTMVDMGYPLHLIDLLAKLYRKKLAKVKVVGTLSHWFRVQDSGCVLSPYFFNILAEMVMMETLDAFQCGLQIGGRIVTKVRYADDIILLATSEAELQELVSPLLREHMAEQGADLHDGDATDH